MIRGVPSHRRPTHRQQRTAAGRTARRMKADGHTAKDIANAVRFLVSDDSRNMTGQSVTVDGGWDV